jgi:2-(1,2-epoxy-1,2-dihydrophenyl)acetyl-CoA isomerase
MAHAAESTAMHADVVGHTILHEVADGIATITMNRPDAANALQPEQRDAMIELLTAAGSTRTIRVVAIRARGRHFCGGADLGSLRSVSDSGPGVGESMQRIMSGAQRLIAAVMDCPKPVVAVVQGSAAGLGAHLAYACDMVVAAEEASFLEPFLSRGIVVDAGGAYLLPRLVGLQRAKELMFLAEKLSAEDAKAMGLVNRVVPAASLDAAAESLLTRLAALPTSAVSFTKRLANASFEQGRSASFLAEAAFQELQSHSADSKEGMASFQERRPSNFVGY